MKGLLEKIKSPQALTKLPDILNVTREDVKTDMSVYELSQLANISRTFDDGGVQIATLPGAPNQHGYISYWILDPEKVQETVDRLIHRETAPIDADAKLVGGIMYSAAK